MSGFFSLGGGYTIHKQQQYQPHENDDQNSIITPNSLYLFKDEEIYTKGFELWQQYYQLHHQNHQHQHDLCLNSNGNEDTWKMMRQGGGYGMGSGGGGGGGGGASGSGINCQDCGNQAKKDCQHMRCRTCCKSRGFQCQTHVKSTWVPAAKRRERQHQLSSLQQPQPQQQSQQQQQHSLGNQQLSLMMKGGGGVNLNPKRIREDHQLMTTVGGGGALNFHHHSTSSGLEIGHFPAEVSCPTSFRCVRVSAMDEAEEQLAYQTAVNIGGHLFKGILYDRGPEDRYNHPGTSAGSQHQQLNLITSGTMGVTVATTSAHPNFSSIDPSSIYPTPLNAFMAGTQFFPPPRS